MGDEEAAISGATTRHATIQAGQTLLEIEAKPQAKLPDLDQLKKNSAQKQIEKINSEIAIFCDYAHHAMGIYLTIEELEQLKRYIELYARRECIPRDITPLRPIVLANADLFHFGWNMWKHFRVGKQYNVGVWLHSTFYSLKDCEVSYIVGKLTINENSNYLIPNIEDIASYIATQNR